MDGGIWYSSSHLEAAGGGRLVLSRAVKDVGWESGTARQRKVSVRVRLREESGSVYNRVLKGLNCCLFGALVVVDWCLPELGNMFGGVGGVVAPSCQRG